MKFYETAKNALLDIFFPRLCIGCSRVIKYGVLCESCFQRVEIRSGYVCATCGNRLPFFKKTCHPNAPFLLIAATNYEGIARDLITQLKYKYVTDAADALARIAINFLERTQPPFQHAHIISIPLHPARQRSRGFNQAELIAGYIARKFDLPIINGALRRVNNTLPQSRLATKEEKEQNIKGCFAVANPVSIKNNHIVLFDDITTTGATLREAATALKNAGARRVHAFVIAKA